MSSMLDGDDDDRSAISSLILTPSGQHSPREDLVSNKLVKFDVSILPSLSTPPFLSITTSFSFFLCIVLCSSNQFLTLSVRDKLTALTHDSANIAT